MRLLLLALLLYLAWRFYQRVTARGRRALGSLPAARLRLTPEPSLFAIHFVNAAGERFRQLNPELPVAGQAEPPLALIEHGSESDAVATYLVGSVQNTGARTIEALELQLALHDASGESLGILRASRDRLLPGEVWTYRVKVASSAASLYRIVALYGSYARAGTRAR